MIVNIETEKNLTVTSEEVNTIVASAINEADNNGFVNRFVFSRAMWVYLYLMLLEDADAKKALKKRINKEGVLNLWDSLVKDGSIGNMLATHEEDVNFVAEVANEMYDSYVQFNQSIRGTIVNIQELGSEMIQSAMGSMNKMLADGKYAEVMNIAQQLGFTQDQEALEQK